MDTDKKKVVAVSVLIVVVFGVALGYYFTKKSNSSTAADVQSAVDAAGNVTDSATQGVIPSIGEAANPLTNKPDINPTSKTNPFQ